MKLFAKIASSFQFLGVNFFLKNSISVVSRGFEYAFVVAQKIWKIWQKLEESVCNGILY